MSIPQGSSDNPLQTNQLPVSLDINPNEPNYQSILLLYLRRIANAVNTKESGFFLLQEVASFEQWFTLNDPQQNKSGYRTTADLVFLNGGVIGPGATPIVLTPTTQPPSILYTTFIPVQGFGGATEAVTGTCHFLNDPNVYFTFTPSTQTITITNNSGNNLTQAYVVLEYLKN